MNGAFTLGENIADLAGLTIAYKAYHISLDGKPAPVIDGFTGDQRFFLSFGQIWRSKYRDGCAARAIALRSAQPARNIAPTAPRAMSTAGMQAFDVTPDDKYLSAAGTARASVVGKRNSE